MFRKNIIQEAVKHADGLVVDFKKSQGLEKNLKLKC